MSNLLSSPLTRQPGPSICQPTIALDSTRRSPLSWLMQDASKALRIDAPRQGPLGVTKTSAPGPQHMASASLPTGKSPRQSPPNTTSLEPAQCRRRIERHTLMHVALPVGNPVADRIAKLQPRAPRISWGNSPSGPETPLTLGHTTTTEGGLGPSRKHKCPGGTELQQGKTPQQHTPHLQLQVTYEGGHLHQVQYEGGHQCVCLPIEGSQTQIPSCLTALTGRVHDAHQERRTHSDHHIRGNRQECPCRGTIILSVCATQWRTLRRRR